MEDDDINTINAIFNPSEKNESVLLLRGVLDQELTY